MKEIKCPKCNFDLTALFPECLSEEEIEQILSDELNKGLMDEQDTPAILKRQSHALSGKIPKPEAKEPKTEWCECEKPVVNGAETIETLKERCIVCKLYVKPKCKYQTEYGSCGMQMHVPECFGIEKCEYAKSQECKCENPKILKHRLDGLKKDWCANCGKPFPQRKPDPRLWMPPAPPMSRKEIEPLIGIDSYAMADKINEIIQEMNRREK